MANLLTGVLGILIFLFIFWKKLREDYASQIIFSSGTYILFGIAIGYILSSKLFPSWFFWFEFLGAVIGFFISVKQFKLRTYETFEAMLVGINPWLALTFLNDSVTRSSPVSFFAFLFCLTLIFTYYFLDLRYRSFSWYKSGRIGLSGLLTFGIFLVARSGVAIFLPNVLSFVGRLEVFISGSLAFVIFLLILNLARKEI